MVVLHGNCMKQEGHFTSLQLKSMNQWPGLNNRYKPVLYMIAPEVDTVYLSRLQLFYDCRVVRV